MVSGAPSPSPTWGWEGGSAVELYEGLESAHISPQMENVHVHYFTQENNRIDEIKKQTLSRIFIVVFHWILSR